MISGDARMRGIAVDKIILLRYSIRSTRIGIPAYLWFWCDLSKCYQKVHYRKVQPVPRELILKPLLEADRVRGSESANGKLQSWSAIWQRIQKLQPAYHRRGSCVCDDGCNTVGSLQAFCLGQRHSRIKCGLETHGEWFRCVAQRSDASLAYRVFISQPSTSVTPVYPTNQSSAWTFHFSRMLHTPSLSVLTEACPNKCWTSVMAAPLLSRRVANVFLRLWEETSSKTALLMGRIDPVNWSTYWWVKVFIYPDLAQLSVFSVSQYIHYYEKQ